MGGMLEKNIDQTMIILIFVFVELMMLKIKFMVFRLFCLISMYIVGVFE